MLAMRERCNWRPIISVGGVASAPEALLVFNNPGGGGVSVETIPEIYRLFTERSPTRSSPDRLKAPSLSGGAFASSRTSSHLKHRKILVWGSIDRVRRHRPHWGSPLSIHAYSSPCRAISYVAPQLRFRPKRKNAPWGSRLATWRVEKRACCGGCRLCASASASGVGGQPTKGLLAARSAEPCHRRRPPLLRCSQMLRRQDTGLDDTGATRLRRNV